MAAKGLLPIETIRKTASIDLLAVSRMIFHGLFLQFESFGNYLSLIYKPLQYSKLVLEPLCKRYFTDIEL